MNGSADRAAGWNGSMKTVLEEVTSDAIDAEHVRRRVDDWEARLNGLYAMIGEWLPDGWESRQGASVLMHEKMMREFGVEATRLPSLELHDGDAPAVRLIPRAVDHRHQRPGQSEGLHRPLHHYRYRRQLRKPHWEVSRADRRSDREPVTHGWLPRILR